jgi:dCMP deaminase
MNRPSRPLVFLGMAREISKRSTCMRLAVGAIVVVNGHQLVAEGYVGHQPGRKHCTGNDCPGRFGCTLTTHAEVNALNRVPVEFAEVDKDIYCTHSPCPQCAGLLPLRKVKRLFYEQEYRNANIKSLLTVGIDVYRVTAAGYIIDQRDQSLVEFT